jgi:hypothetical protein
MTRLSKANSKFTKKTDGLTNNKIRETIATKLDNTIDAHNALARIVQKNQDDLDERLNNISIVQRAIAELVGTEKVNEAAKKIRVKLLEDEAAVQGDNVAKGVESGDLAKTETVEEGTLVVTTIKQADGTQMYPSKNYLPYGYYKPEVQAIISGRKIGDVLPLPGNGGTIEILELYVEVKPAKPDTVN